MNVDQQVLFGLIATCLAIYGYMPYFYGMYRGVTKPHAFSWLIGAILAFIAFFIQMSEGAGPGAWMMGYTAFACIGIFVFSLKYLSTHLRPFDWFCLAASLISIPIWLMMDNPLAAMILVMAIDVVAFLPTVRKSWARPWDENIQMYAVNVGKFAVSILGLTQITLTTILFPAGWVIVNSAFIIFLMIRRKTLVRTV